jgi:hypothetical protein
VGIESNLNLRFVFEKERAINKLEDLELDKLLTAIAGDIYSPEQIVDMRKKILSSEYRGVRIGGVEIQIKNPNYWFGIGASEETEASVWFSVDEIFYYRYDKRAAAIMSDFAKRARAAFEVMKPWHGYVATGTDIDALEDSYGAAANPRAHFCWLNYYSPELLAELGRDKVLSAARETSREWEDVIVDELTGGAVILQMGDLPLYINERTNALEKKFFGRICKADANKV